MTSCIEGKSIAITGGTTGLGYALIRELLNKGAKNVAVLDIHDANNVVKSLQKKFDHQKIIYLQTDVTDKKNVKNSFRQAIDTFGNIDVVIGNAGIFDERRPDRTIMVNLIGIVHSTYEAIDHMSTFSGGNGGVIVNIASTLGLDVMNSTPAYCASKHGIIGLMKSLGSDFNTNLHGIKFITICPGFTEPRMAGAALPGKLPWGIGVGEMELAHAVMLNQPSSVYAKVAVNILNEAKNSSIWIIDCGKQREVLFEPRWKKF